MTYIIMCGGEYTEWEKPRQLVEIKGEPIIARTIRLLKEQGVEDIAISSNNPVFKNFGVPVLHHENNFVTNGHGYDGCYWFDCFYPTSEPVCYVFGDVIFSRNAIEKIVSTEATDYEFFASAPPFSPEFHKESAEPYALKVIDQEGFRESLKLCRVLTDRNLFKRKPIMWEVWQVLKGTPLNIIDYTNYTVINDFTCDIDHPDEVRLYENFIGDR